MEFPTFEPPLIIVEAKVREWRKIRFEQRMRVRKNTRNFCAPARTAINHIISVNGACKTREGSASLCSFVYNTREERNTSGRMSDPNHVLRGTRVLEGGGREGEERRGVVRRYRMCSNYCRRMVGIIWEFGSFETKVGLFFPQSKKQVEEMKWKGWFLFETIFRYFSFRSFTLETRHWIINIR